MIGYETLLDPYPLERRIYVQGDRIMADGRF